MTGRAVLHALDVALLVGYLAAMVAIGVAVMRRGSSSLDAYFLADKRLPWYLLGLSNASAMWDITGTMWLVYNLFVYGMKGLWLPWLWPTFNQVFLMMYLSVWVRRANVLTGAEWITTRFGQGPGAELSRGIVVVFALLSVVGFVAYDFQGVGKFAATVMPWDLSPNTYAVALMTVTLLYVLMGGLVSVVLTDVAQYLVLTLCSVAVAAVALRQVDAAQLAAAVPPGWSDLWFTFRLDVDWSSRIPALERHMVEDGYALFGPFFVAMLFKGILVSIAGPAPNYDMQRILAARSPREAALMSGVVSAALVPRWLMVASITVLALPFLGPRFRKAGAVDFELVLPWVIREQVPSGLLGLMLAALMAAFMSTFSATLNAGGAYVVNDLYKRYVRREAPPGHYVTVGRLAQVVIVLVGISFGFQAASINQVTQWIVSGLWGGYSAPNILKWHWWRFNGFGFFWGMTAGIATAIALPRMAPTLHPLYGFPAIFAVSLAASVAGALLTAPEPEAILVQFYRRVRPWGLWGPVRAKVMAEDPSFRVDGGAARVGLNVVIGTVWQLTLVLLPVSLVLRDGRTFWTAALLFAAASVFLKRSWLDRLEKA